MFQYLKQTVPATIRVLNGRERRAHARFRPLFRPVSLKNALCLHLIKHAWDNTIVKSNASFGIHKIVAYTAKCSDAIAIALLRKYTGCSLETVLCTQYKTRRCLTYVFILVWVPSKSAKRCAPSACFET